MSKARRRGAERKESEEGGLKRKGRVSSKREKEREREREREREDDEREIRRRRDKVKVQKKDN